MKQETKKAIIEALQQYAKANDLNAAQLSKTSGVSESYVNALLNGRDYFNKTKISAEHFKKIAKAIGYEFEREFWRHEDTPQYLTMYKELLDAKASGRMKVLIGKTRHGKTYTLDRFMKQVPKHSYRITVSSLYRLKDIVNEMCDLLNLDITGSYVARMKRISKNLNDKKLNGAKPTLYIDEAENMTIPVLRMMKALYDEIKDSCPIVLIGTPQLLKKLERLNEKDIEGMPQFYARFKAGIRWIDDIEKNEDFRPFLELVEDKNLRTLLWNLADNYGELNDYLEYALREADRMGEPLTEKLFKNLFNL